MRVEHDRDADAMYLRFRDAPYAFGVDLDHARHVDYAEDGLPIGIELLNVSGGVNVDDLPERDAVLHLLEEHDIRVYAHP